MQYFLVFKKTYLNVIKVSKKVYYDDLKNKLRKVRCHLEVWCAIRKFQFKSPLESVISIAEWKIFYESILPNKSTDN